MPKTLLPLFFLLFTTALGSQTTFHKKQSGSFVFTSNITPIDNNGFIISSLANQNGTAGGIYKLSEQGQVVWAIAYPPFKIYGAMLKTGSEVVATGYIQQGSGQLTTSHAGLLKFAADGSVIWAKELEQSNTFTSKGELIEAPNGFIYSGQRPDVTSGNTQPQTFITRYNQSGNIIWSKTYENSFINNAIRCKYIQGDTIYATGNIRGNGCFVRINLNTGELISVNAFGQIYLEDFTSMEPTSDGNFLIAGTTISVVNEFTIPWVVKISPTGQIIWSKTYNYPGQNISCALAKSPTGNFVLAIQSSLVAIDEDGHQIWAKNYSGGQNFRLSNITFTSDNGIIAIGNGNNGLNVLLKTDSLGNVANGCCPELLQFVEEDFYPPSFNYSFAVLDWGSQIPVTVIGEPTTLNLEDYCQLPLTSVTQSFELCPGDSLEINGTLYGAPFTLKDTIPSLNGGCDTLKIYNLTAAIQPFIYKTIKFCPGTSVTINGTAYTQPTTFTQVIPASVGCDTVMAYLLQYGPLPKRTETINFCYGDTIWIGGAPYWSPNFVIDTILGVGNSCDTIVTYLLNLLDFSASNVSMQCPDNTTVYVNSAGPQAITYPGIVAASDCPCPAITVSLEQGLPSGALFPMGTTTVCYRAEDACNHTASCCFQINVEEENACDTKEIGCLKFEILGVTTDTAQNHAYRIRVTNNCPSPLVYAAIELPNTVEAVAPVPSTPYVSPTGRLYDIRNPSLSPFRSIRYKAATTGIANGQSDVFEYTLPAQANPTFIHIGASLGTQTFFQTTLNTFGCNVQTANRSHNPKETISLQQDLGLKLFPNPTSGKLMVDLSAWPEQELKLSIINSLGVLVSTFNITPKEDMETITLPMEWPNGLYWLNVKTTTGEKSVVKFTLSR